MGRTSTNHSILNPFTIIGGGNFEIFTQPSNEMWNKGNTLTTLNNNVVNKTIYDPCPSNYKIPRSAAFSYCNSSGGDQNGNFNVSGSFNKGWYFYTNGWQTGTTYFLPALGNRENGLTGVGGAGNYFVSARENNDRVRQLYFQSGRVAVNDVYGSSVARNVLGDRD